MKTILFQGDSITDGHRDKQDDHYMGCGYATLVSAHLGLEHPNEYKFYNRGIAGVGIANLLSRTIFDFTNLSPDLISILIGVNDVCPEIAERGYFDHKKWEALYTILLEELKGALPNLKLILMSPFLLDNNERYPKYIKDLEIAIQITKNLAEKFDAEYIPLMDIFEEAKNLAPAEFWLFDGVHPTPAGHELIKRHWLEAFNRIKL